MKAAAITIFHNLACGKLVELIPAMGTPVRDLLRRKGTPYDKLKLEGPAWSDDRLIDFMVEHPILMNRPIVVHQFPTPAVAHLERLARPDDRACRGD